MKEINWDEIKFRASSWGNLMTSPQSKEAKERGDLSATCQKELIKIYCTEVYGRKKEIVTRKMDKGIQGEEDSITLFSRVEKKFFRKNEVRLENEWFTGHVDIFVGPEIERAEEVWDIKTRWELESFMPKLTETLDKSEYFQLQCYFSLTGAKRGGIANTLIDCPENILMEEKRRLLYSMNVISEESPEYIEAANELERLLTFPDIDYRERVIKQSTERNDELIQKMKDKVPIFRSWLKEFHQKHMNQYPK